MSYRSNFAGSSSVGYVDFTISPDFGTPVFPGDIVTISGKVRWNQYAIRAIEIVYDQFPISSGGYGSYSAVTSVSIAKSKEGSFSISFTVTDEIYEKMTSRFGNAGAKLEIWVSNKLPSNEYPYEAVGATDSTGYMRYGKYRLNPRILSMDFERCNASGAWADDGEYLRCKELKIEKAAQAALSDITTANIVCAGSDGSRRSVSILSKLSAALSSGGYSESGYASGNIFYGFASNKGVTYTLTLTLGDAYDQNTYADKVNRSFARLHLSGAENGGVAIGMFSSATDSKPKFEVADTHESHFYGPAFFEGGVSGAGGDYQAGEAETGGKWIDGKPIYRYVWSGAATGNGNRVLVTIPVTIGTLLSVKGSVMTSKEYYSSTHVARSGDAYNCALYVEPVSGGAELHLTAGSSISGTVSVVAIIEYTKA